MATARKRLIDPRVTPFYHCISRCVRRSFLCGECHLTGKNYEHRKTWVLNRLSKLSHVFAIDIASYAVMSNHYHLVLRMNIEKAEQLSDVQVIKRWAQLFSIPQTIKLAQQENATEEIKIAAQKIIETWRFRLCNVSWFMRCLNEYLARRANKEDECTGRFWEGRFKSQALLDESAVITAMAYTDLNPVRAKAAESIEESRYTSIYERDKRISNKTGSEPIKLMPLACETSDQKPPLELSMESYKSLINWSAQSLIYNEQIMPCKKTLGVFAETNLLPVGFINCMKKKDDIKGLRVIGDSTTVKHFLEKADCRFFKGASFCRQLYRRY